MVAVAWVRGRASTQPSTWLAGSVLVLLAGTLLRVALGGVSVPVLSAAWLSAVLWTCVWLAALLLTTARSAFAIGVATMALLTVSALPARSTVDYDDRQALYTTDQAMTREVNLAPGDTLIVVLAEPVFSGPEPRFGLLGTVGGRRAAWTCPWRTGVQRLALPLPAGSSGPQDIQISLSGTPARDGDYLLVYGSARHGGPLVSPVNPTALAADALRCQAS